MMSLSGFQHIMRFRIVSKLEKFGATSKEKAATVEDLGLDMQEQQWLRYLAGAFLGKIKKTEDQRYYV